MTNPHVGQQDGENALSEMHEREVKMFAAHLEGQNANNAQGMSWSIRNFAMADLIKAGAYMVNAATTLGLAGGITWLCHWWF